VARYRFRGRVRKSRDRWLACITFDGVELSDRAPIPFDNWHDAFDKALWLRAGIADWARESG